MSVWRTNAWNQMQVRLYLISRSSPWLLTAGNMNEPKRKRVGLRKDNNSSFFPPASFCRSNQIVDQATIESRKATRSLPSVDEGKPLGPRLLKDTMTAFNFWKQIISCVINFIYDMLERFRTKIHLLYTYRYMLFPPCTPGPGRRSEVAQSQKEWGHATSDRQSGPKDLKLRMTKLTFLAKVVLKIHPCSETYQRINQSAGLQGCFPTVCITTRHHRTNT